MAKVQEMDFSRILHEMQAGLFAVKINTGEIFYYNKEAQRLLGHEIPSKRNLHEIGDYGAIHEDGTPYRSDEYPSMRASIHGETVVDHDMLYRKGPSVKTWLRVNAGKLHKTGATRLQKWDPPVCMIGSQWIA